MGEKMKLISCDVGYVKKAKFLVWDGAVMSLAI